MGRRSQEAALGNLQGWPYAPAVQTAPQPPPDCSAMVLDGLWPYELMQPRPEHVAAARHLQEGLLRIAGEANRKLWELYRLPLPLMQRQAEETRIVNLARSFAVLRVESTVRALGQRPALGSSSQQPDVGGGRHYEPELTQHIPAELVEAARLMNMGGPAEQPRKAGPVHVERPPIEAEIVDDAVTSPEPVVSVPRHARPELIDDPTIVVSVSQGPDGHVEVEVWPDEKTAVDALTSTVAPSDRDVEVSGPSSSPPPLVPVPPIVASSDVPPVRPVAGAQELQQPPVGAPRIESQWGQAPALQLPRFDGPVRGEAVSQPPPVVSPVPPILAPSDLPPVRQEPPTQAPRPMASGAEHPRGGLDGRPRQLGLPAGLSLERVVSDLARQQPSLSWVAGARRDGSMIVATDVVGGWIPPGVVIPSGVTVLEPKRRTGSMEEWIGPVVRTVSYAPGDRIGSRVGDVGARVAESVFSVVDVDDALGYELVAAIEAQETLPPIALLLAKKGVSGGRAADGELDVLKVHVEMVASSVLAGYPSVSESGVKSLMLLGAAEGLAAGQMAVAAYHFGWFKSRLRAGGESDSV